MPRTIVSAKKALQKPTRRARDGMMNSPADSRRTVSELLPQVEEVLKGVGLGLHESLEKTALRNFSAITTFLNDARAQPSLKCLMPRFFSEGNNMKLGSSDMG